MVRPLTGNSLCTSCNGGWIRPQPSLCSTCNTWPRRPSYCGGCNVNPPPLWPRPSPRVCSHCNPRPIIPRPGPSFCSRCNPRIPGGNSHLCQSCNGGRFPFNSRPIVTPQHHGVGGLAWPSHYNQGFMGALMPRVSNVGGAMPGCSGCSPSSNCGRCTGNK